MSYFEKHVGTFVFAGLTGLIVTAGAVLAVLEPQSWLGALAQVSSGPPPAAQNFEYMTSMDLKANGSDGPVSVANAVDVSFTWTSSEATFTCSIGNSGVVGGPSAGQVSWKPPVGTNVVVAVCGDPEGHTATDSVAVTVAAPVSSGEGGPIFAGDSSTFLPNVSFEFPFDQSTVSARIEIKARATVFGGYSAASVQFSLDGTPISGVITRPVPQ